MYSPQRVSRSVAEQAYLGNEPDYVDKGCVNSVADGPLRRNGDTPGQLICSYSAVVGEEGEAQGDGPAEHQLSDHPRQPVQENGSRVTSA